MANQDGHMAGILHSRFLKPIQGYSTLLNPIQGDFEKLFFIHHQGEG
jgi:hypothetical protein